MTGVEPEVRRPPQDIQAEQAVLGGMLLSAEAISVVSTLLTKKDFYRPVHGVIYEVMLDLYERGEPVDPVTVADALMKVGTPRATGGAPYLHTLLEVVPTAANAGYYAEIVADKSTRRRMVESGTRIVQMGFGEDSELGDLIDQAQEEIHGLTLRGDQEDFMALGGVIQEAMDDLERSSDQTRQGNVLTGFKELDAMTNGLGGGQFCVIAGRPGLGKSTLGLDIARCCAIRQTRTVLMFSLEMSRIEIAQRLLSAEARVQLQNMRAGRMTDDDWQRLVTTMSMVVGAPMLIDDSVNVTMAEIRSKCRRVKQQYGLDLAIVDYLQLMGSAGNKFGSRQEEVSGWSRGMKLLAKDLDVPVIAICQLNRGPEARPDRKPLLSDLRDSGALEQDADLVILLHREDVHDPETERKGEADLIIAKQRNGPTGTVTLAFQGHYSRFVEMGD